TLARTRNDEAARAETSSHNWRMLIRRVGRNSWKLPSNRDRPRVFAAVIRFGEIARGAQIDRPGWTERLGALEGLHKRVVVQRRKKRGRESPMKKHVDGWMQRAKARVVLCSLQPIRFL